MCSALLLVEPANRRVVAKSRHGRGPKSLGWTPAARQEGLSSWRRIKKDRNWQSQANYTHETYYAHETLYTHETIIALMNTETYISFVVHLVAHCKQYLKVFLERDLFLKL